MTLQQHVLFRAVSLILSDKQVLNVPHGEHVSFRPLALGFPNTEVLILDP